LNDFNVHQYLLRVAECKNIRLLFFYR